MGTAAVLTFLAVIIGFIVYGLIKDKKKGKGSCGCNCENCSACCTADCTHRDS